jgi:chemotaxis regulatin CheY-phosphate phosphatase CheZ
MPQVPAPAPYSDADYEMIAAAVLETARGRWFLAEHAKRNRQADTRLVLEAIEKLERSIAGKAEGIEPDRVRVDLVEMMNAITRTKAEIAAIRPTPDNPSHFGHASTELDAIVDTTEKATGDILAAAERIQEIAWTLREQGVDAGVCDLIDAHATEVYTACSFQDLTGQRIRKVIEVLRFIEERIETMIQIWRLDDLEFVQPGGSTHVAPAVRGEPGIGDSLRQAAVDQLMGNERKQDVVWHDNRIAESRDPRNLGEFDLEDLVVFETAADAQAGNDTPTMPLSVMERDQPDVAPAQPVPVPAPTPTPAKPIQPAEEKRTVEELTFAERMALFG